MNRIQVVGLVVAVVLIGATIVFFAIPYMSNGPVCSGGVYSATISGPIAQDLGQPLYNLTYAKNGVHESGYYYSYMSGAMSWIKVNTPQSALFMNWWDYGKEIVGCTGRGTVISNPSARFIALGFSANQNERDTEQSLTEVGNALFATNATLTRSIAEKYGAGYMLITVEDGGSKAPYILQYLGLRPSDYLVSNSTIFTAANWTTLGQQTLVYRLLDGQSVPGFAQVYSDDYVRVFSVG
jgi:hypothetical protein